MCERKSRSPARRLFQDFSNRNDRVEETVDEIIDRITDLKCSTFRETYQFDLKDMQPCSSESDLRINCTINRQLRHCWSWEAVNARLVPRFYHPVIFQSRRLEKITTQKSMVPPETPLKPLREPRVSPPVKLFFPTVRRAKSVDAVERKTFNNDLASPKPSTVRKGQTKTTIPFEVGFNFSCQK
ncbi:unnamed protein product [Taenia asiatica]|uniref:Uncharacterized protein n=1 Tax=Taenia asiatica TaxID=60517 RepID=A0A0R3VVM0_TAEAS|nr:unnamed protein product [Taenia asiatica]